MSLTCFGKAHLLNYAVKLLIIGVRFTEFYCAFDLLDMVVRIINPWFFLTTLKKRIRHFITKLLIHLQRGVWFTQFGQYWPVTILILEEKYKIWQVYKQTNLDMWSEKKKLSLHTGWAENNNDLFVELIPCKEL